MNTHTVPTAYALFGSAARGDFDVFSDLDLLIVSDDGPALRAMKSRYNASGWSCTAYSWDRLQRAADQGSLFVQHLQQESKILSDPSDRLSHLLAQYSPKGDYKQESDGAASLLGNLLQQLPKCDQGPMWTLDVLSVGFRSLAVAALADNGIYVFANSEIINGLTKIGLINRDEGYQLSRLRRFKSLYRRGIIDQRIGWSETYDWIRLIDKVFVLGLSSKCVGERAMVDLAMADRNNILDGSHWYVRCRRIESALWMLKPRQNSLRSEFLKRRRSLFGIVKSPNSYAWHFTGGYGAIQNSLSDLINLSAV